MDHGEFSEVEGCRVLNQTHSPESSLRWSAVDPLFSGADEMGHHVKASGATASRGLRLHRAERTEDEATRRVAGGKKKKERGSSWKRSHRFEGWDHEVWSINVTRDTPEDTAQGWEADKGRKTVAMKRGNACRAKHPTEHRP